MTMIGKKIYEVTRDGGQTCWVVAKTFTEAGAKGRVYFKRNYTSRSVINKIELIGTIDG